MAKKKVVPRKSAKKAAKKKSKKKKKKAIDQDIDSPFKEEDWDFSKIGRRMMKNE